MIRAAIDSPADGSRLAPGPLRVHGWALDEKGPLQDALLLIGRRFSIRPRFGVHRLDLVEAFPDIAHALKGGFECDVELGPADAGPLRLDLLVRTAARGWEPVTAIGVTVDAGAPRATARRPRAAFTIAQNEPDMLPLWLEYYGRYFDPGDLYVLDHASSDGSTDQIGDRCHVVPVHRLTSWDHRWLRETVESFQRFLLQSYETVVFTEADEFIIADPSRYSGLDHYVESLRRPAARCVGFNVVHEQGEPPLRFERRPLLSQRRLWRRSDWFCKRLVSRIPLHWSEGFHEEYNAPDDPPDPALMLAHLAVIDYGWCLQRQLDKAARNWNPEDVARGTAAHNRITDREQFDEWFRAGAGSTGPREPIPESIRGVL